MEEKRTKRIPKCGYCQNHGIKNPLRAHKRDCKFLDCQCKLCVNTRLRREHMADMQYIKRNGMVELERLQNDQDAQEKKKDIYEKIFQERMANKNKKRIVEDLRSGNSTQDALLLADTTGSSSALSPNSSSITDPSSGQLAAIANLRDIRSFIKGTGNSSNSMVNNLASTSLDSPSLDAQVLANHLHSTTNTNTNTSTPNHHHNPHHHRSYAALFPNANDNNSMVTNDHLLKAAKLLGIGLQSPSSTSPHTINNNNNNITSSSSLSVTFRNEDNNVDLNELSEFIDRLSIVNSLNNDEKVLNAAICILFNSLPLTLLNPSNVAEEIYSTFKQLNSTNIFR